MDNIDNMKAIKLKGQTVYCKPVASSIKTTTQTDKNYIK